MGRRKIADEHKMIGREGPKSANYPDPGSSTGLQPTTDERRDDHGEGDPPDDPGEDQRPQRRAARELLGHPQRVIPHDDQAQTEERDKPEPERRTAAPDEASTQGQRQRPEEAESEETAGITEQHADQITRLQPAALPRLEDHRRVHTDPGDDDRA